MAAVPKSVKSLLEKERWLLLVGTACVFSFIWFYIGSETSGRYVPHTDLRKDYLIGISTTGVLFILLWMAPITERLHLLILWLLKSMVVLGFMLFFEYSYAGQDAYGYFKSALLKLVPVRLYFEVSGDETRHNVTVLNTLLLPFIGYSYHALKVVYAFIGLWGSYLFYRALAVYMRERNIDWLYLIVLFPSLLFWTSNIGKDCLIILSMGIYVYGVVNLLEKRSLLYLLPSLSGILLGTLIRPQMAPILAAPLGIAFIFNCKNNFDRLLTVILAGLIVWWSALLFQFYCIPSSDLSLRLDLGSFARLKEGVLGDWFNTLNWRGVHTAIGGSRQAVVIFNDLYDVFTFLPLGVFTLLFRPLIWESRNIFMLLAGLENTFLLLFFLAAMGRFKRSFLKDVTLLWILLLLLSWAVPYCFVSYQNLGTAVRWKVPILPILVFLIISLGKKSGYLLTVRHHPLGH